MRTFSLSGAAWRGAASGVIYATLMYPINFGFVESVLDGLFFALAMTLVIYAQGRVRPLVRRFVKPS